MTTTLEALALRIASAALPLLGRRLQAWRNGAKLSEGSRDVPYPTEAAAFVEGLTPEQVALAAKFVRSEGFGYMVRHALIQSLGPKNDNSTSDLRDHVRAVLKAYGTFKGADNTQMADVFLDTIGRAIETVKAASQPGTLERPSGVANASDIAASIARGHEVMQRLGSLEAVHEFATRLRSQVVGMHGKIALPNAVQSRLVSYQQLYVPPTIRVDTSLWQVADFVGVHPRAVILGDPGAGKSTLAAKLVYDLAASRADGVERTLPILLVARRHTESLRTKNVSLLRYLEASCVHPYNVEPPDGALEYLLLNGGVTVVIDGVDELGEGSTRTEFVRLVEGFVHLYPLTPIVVTSRVIGYSEARLDMSLFETGVVMSFDEAQCAQYAQKWFRLDKSLAPEEQASMTQSFLSESTEVADLRSNPLVLSLLCVLYTAEHTIPNRRPEIYERCAELLFDSWDRSRGLGSFVRYRQHLRPVIQQLAWFVFNDSRGRRAIPRTEMHRMLCAFLRPRFRNVDDADQAAADFLTFCAGRAWVITDIGSDAFEPHYGFVHQTFLEYFAASQLVKQTPDTAAMWSVLREMVVKGEWHNVVPLAAQLWDRERGEGDQLVRFMAEASRRDERNRRAVLFAATRVLDSVTPSYATVTDVVGQIVDLACSIPPERRVGKRGGFESFAHRDEPLMNGLLSIRSSGHVDDWSAFIVECLAERASVALPTRSAPIVYACLSMNTSEPGRPMAAAVRDQLMARRVPEAAARWRRIVTQPLPQDVRHHGFTALHEPLFIGTSTRFSYMRRCGQILFRGRDSGDDAASAEVQRGLGALYEEVVADLNSNGWLSRVAEEWYGSQNWLEVFGRMSLSDVRRLDVRARAVALLCIYPFMRTRYRDIQDEELALFASASAEPARRDAAVKLLNSWGLPSDAHDHLADAIARKPADQGGGR